MPTRVLLKSLLVDVFLNYLDIQLLNDVNILFKYANDSNMVVPLLTT